MIMNPFMSDQDLLDLASSKLGLDAGTLMERYYGGSSDAEHELDEFRRTGKLQDSFAAMLRFKLEAADQDAQAAFYDHGSSAQTA